MPAIPAPDAEFQLRPRVLWTVVGLLLALHAVLAWIGRMPGVLTGEDEAIYLLLARQLSHLSYRDVFLVHQPMHAMYPPGYPAMLAVWGFLAGQRFDGFLVFSIVCSVAALLLVFLTVRQLWSSTIALLVLAALAVNPFLIDRAGTLASEAPYMLLTMVVLWCAVRGDRRHMIVAGTAAVAAALTRSIGLTAVAALAAHWLWGRRFAAAGAGVAAALVGGGWVVWSFTAPGKLVGASYAADFTQAGYVGAAAPSFPMLLLGRIVTNVPSYLTVILPQILPLPAIGGTPVDNGIDALLTVACLAIGAVALWRKWRAAALYLAATGAVLAVWPWRIERFAFPVLPLLITAMLLGAGALVGRRWPRWRFPAMALLSGILVLTSLVQVTADLSAMERCDRGRTPPAASCVTPDQNSFFQALSYTRTELPPDAILLTSKRATAYYYSGRREMQWQRAAAAGSEHVIDFLRGEGVGYVLLGSLHWADLDQLPNVLEPNCAALDLVRAFPPRTYLLRVRGAGEPDDGSGCQALKDHRIKNQTRDFERNR